jgi:YD repeat-containing protein
MRRILQWGFPVALCGLGAAGLALASEYAPPMNETINYTYDARGRLVKVEHSGTVNNNVQANYSYDKADNRVTVNVTGAP